MPNTEHSAQILAGSWPSQSVTSWSGYAMAFTQAANSLFKELDVQIDIKEILAPMDGAFIDAARRLANGRETALQNRIEAYRHISKSAHWAANELHSTKSDLVEIVKGAEEAIRLAREAAEKAKAAAQGTPAAAATIAAIEAQLQTAITEMVTTAKGLAQARDLQGATTVTALSTDISQWAAPFANSILPDSGGTPAAPGSNTQSPQGMLGAQSVDFTTTEFGDTKLWSDPKQANSSPQQSAQDGIQQTAFNQPDKLDPADVARSDKSPSVSPPASSAPSAPSTSSGGSGSNPASGLAQMLNPSSGSSSPASSGSPAGNPATAAQTGQVPGAAKTGTGAAGSGAGTGSGTGAGAGPSGASRAASLANLGGGMAESSARMASGAVSATANSVSTGTNVGANVAQSAASAAPAATGVPPAASGGMAAGGAAPMAMAPPGGAGAGVVNPVASGGPAAATPPGPAASNTGPASAGGGAAGAGAGTSAGAAAGGGGAAPVAVPGIRGIGADGASGEAVFEQAMDAGRDVITSLVAQTLGVAYIDIHYAAAVVWERSGTVAAWMATSEGASYIPLGVGVPHDVRLSVTDPVAGNELWTASAAAGGTNPLETVVRQAQVRGQAAPGARVLAIASSLPMDQVIDWAGTVGARPVGVDPRTVVRAASSDGSLSHRCAVAMPWEWQQANAFSERERERVAGRHMHMAATAGHLAGQHACEQVINLFEERKPISDALWAAVNKERFMALIQYQMAVRSAGQGGAESPARLLAMARAAEVVLCLRHCGTAKGCADLLYAARLAGVPLNADAAVTA
ncbi:MAG: hypothetical protein K0U84_20390 [Actinomycetia bacterium]|nr:hypothetical protein [Actinomycetes bacterium]